jgi:hypothetical protein
MREPKHTDGRPYTGNQQFAGNGVQRSCDRCGKHVAPARLKSYGRLRLMCCDRCRGVA